MSKPKTGNAAPDLDTLIDQVIAAVPDLNDLDGPAAEVHKLAALRDRLESDRKRIIAELAHCSADGPMGPGTTVRYDPGADAAALLNGAPIETLTAPVEESYRAGLLRQLRAAEAGLEQVRDRIPGMNQKVAAEQFARLRPLIARVIGKVLDRYRDLCAALEALNSLDHELARKGLSVGPRPPLMTGFDSRILGGGQNWPMLGYYVEERAKTWNSDEDGKPAKQGE
ncbi:MAG: hypothetical protein M1376_02145 [Planctomycetes bacterium]|nr:hypothetical protein [Planctomycetota bacterium]